MLLSIGRFRYIASRAERSRFVCNPVWAFNLAPAFPRRALTLCPQLSMGILPRRYTEIGLFQLAPLRNGKQALEDLTQFILVHYRTIRLGRVFRGCAGNVKGVYGAMRGMLKGRAGDV